MPPDVHALLLVHPQVRFRYYEQFLTSLKFLQLWMTTMWIIASGTTGESSGASAIAKNAIGVWNLTVSRSQHRPLKSSCEGFGLFRQHSPSNNLIESSPRGRPELDVSQTAALNRLLSRSVKTTPRTLRLERSIATVRHFTSRKLTCCSNPLSLR
ncbi:hypothetical protein F5887DRAFT_679370 [Amanita rubescens]|nr:hypothetical protein F5887DRAFT_679370 [Amanita rubescens]